MTKSAYSRLVLSVSDIALCIYLSFKSGSSVIKRLPMSKAAIQFRPRLYLSPPELYCYLSEMAMRYLSNFLPSKYVIPLVSTILDHSFKVPVTNFLFSISACLGWRYERYSYSCEDRCRPFRSSGKSKETTQLGRKAFAIQSVGIS
jgi:hypothetical protein